MTRMTQPHFLAKESGVFLLQAADSKGFIPIQIIRPTQK